MTALTPDGLLDPKPLCHCATVPLCLCATVPLCHCATHHPPHTTVHHPCYGRGVRLQGFIFDIDGTLVDSNDIHAECWREAFQHFGKSLPYDLVRHQIGKGGDLLVPDLCTAREMRRFGEQIKDYRGDLFKKKYMKRIEPFPGVSRLLRDLHQKGFRLALASSANPDEVKYYTSLLEAESLIEGSTSKDDAQMSKPSPEIFEAALETIGTDPQFTMVVGDTPYDILAAHRIALPVVAVRSGGFEDELLSKAEFLLDSVEDIRKELDRIDAYFDDDQG